jgi:hypothetical protein
MPEGTEKDLSIDEEQSEEVAGGLNLDQSALKRARVVDAPLAAEPPANL